MNFRPLRPLLVAAVALSLGTAARADDTVVAQRGNVTLTLSQLKAALSTQTAETLAAFAANPAALNNFVDNLLIGRVLLAQAEAAKWDQKPAVQAALIRSHDTIVLESYLADQAKLPAGYPPEDTIKTAYQQNLAALMQPRRYHLQEILIAVPAGADQATNTAAYKKALAVRALALKPGADFPNLAASDSTDPTVATAKGEIGWVPEDKLVSGVKTVIQGLAVGGVSAPLHAVDGWHLFKLVDTVAAEPLPYAQARDQIAQALRQKQVQQAAQAYLNKLTKDEPIQLNAIAIGTALGAGK